jgi:hypothetical protein
MTEQQLLEDKIDHIEKLLDMEWNGTITAKHCIHRITSIIRQLKPHMENNNEQ